MEILCFAVISLGVLFLVLALSEEVIDIETGSTRADRWSDFLAIRRAVRRARRRKTTCRSRYSVNGLTVRKEAGQ